MGYIFTPLKKIQAGFVCAMLSMIVAALIQHFIYVKSPCGSRVGEGSARTGPPDRMLGEYHGQPNSVRGRRRRIGAHRLLEP